MSLAQMIDILRARKWVFLAITGVVMLATLALSLVLPRQYLGTASVVVDVRPDPVSVTGLPPLALTGFMATQIDILNSERVALRVIQDLGLARDPQVRQQWLEDTEGRGSVEQWLVGALQKRLDVQPSRDSNVISIQYKAPDPRFAAGLANAFAQAYIATTLELRVNPAQNFSRFFDQRTKEARTALEQAQTRLSEFQVAKGIVASDERFDIENARLNELSTQLTLMQSATADSSSRQTQAAAGRADQLQEVLANPVVAGLKSDLARAQAKLQELLQRLGEANPQVQQARANIGELQQRIASETRRLTGGVAVADTINRQREAQIRQALEQQRQRVLQMKAVRDEGLVLVREVENAQRLYDGLAGRFNQTTLEAQSTQSYVGLLSEAREPAEPSSPRPVLNTVIGTFLGALLALAAVLVLELADRRVRSPEDAVAVLGLPVLGVLPTPGAKRYLPGSRRLLAPPRPDGPQPSSSLTVGG